MCYIIYMSTFKTTAELQKRLEQIQKDIFSSEAAIGRALLTSAENGIDAAVLAEYTEYEHLKDSLRSDIDSIREIVAKSVAIRKESEAFKKQAAELNSEWNPLYEKLGCALSDAIDSRYGAAFEQYRIAVAEQRKKEQEARTALETLRQQMETQSFMNRLLTQVQYTARNSAFVQLQKRLAQLYVKSALAVFESGVLEPLYAEGTLSAEVSAAYAPCADLKRRINQLSADAADCENRFQKNEQLLAGKGASGNGERRIENITREIEQLNGKQYALAQKTGHEFAGKYVTPDGEILVPYDDVSGKDVQSHLDKIAVNRAEAVSCNRKMEIISLTAKIDSAGKRIELLQRNIGENELKIHRLTEENASLQQSIVSQSEERDLLVAKRSELEMEDAGETKRIQS